MGGDATTHDGPLSAVAVMPDGAVWASGAGGVLLQKDAL